MSAVTAVIIYSQKVTHGFILILLTSFVSFKSPAAQFTHRAETDLVEINVCGKTEIGTFSFIYVST